MRDRYWLERGFCWLLSQRLSCVHQVIWSLRPPAELLRVIVNVKGNGGAHVCAREDRDARTETKRWARPIKLSPQRKKLNEHRSLSCRCGIIRLTVLCVSPSSLASSSSTSSLILLLSPEWSRVQRMSFCKCLTRRLWSAVQAAALSVLCCSKCWLY